MGAVTYPEPSVADAIHDRFVPIQINVGEHSSKPLLECYHQFWTPDFRILDSDGVELYRWNGYLPPFEFLAQLLAAQAHAYLRLQNNSGAAEIYQDLLERFPTSAIAPEAQYFLAVSKYKASGQPPDLMDNWKRLQRRYPNSVWRIKQSFVENA